MICEFCTYDVRKSKQDEFEVLVAELAEYCRIADGIGGVSCVRQEADERLTYVLSVERRENTPDIIALIHQKYGRRFERCVEGEPRVVIGDIIA